MPVHPLAQELIDQIASQPPLETLTVAQSRARAMEMVKKFGPGEPVATVREVSAPAPSGGIPIRLYTPDGKGPFGVFVFLHGGGWVVGNLETSDFYCRAVTNAAGCIVASVNYRHAPEHKFPAAVEDAYAATLWMHNHAAGFNGDPARLAVGGTSAGANLAAAVTLMARDRIRPPIAFQVLSVPVTDHNFDSRSYVDNAADYGLTRAAMQWFWNHYLESEADGANPLASPLRAKDLRGLPPAFVQTAEYDPLRDEGDAYARRLTDAGVPVTHQRYDGMIHMFLGTDSIADVGKQLRTAFAK